jgi:glucokinase
MSARRRLPEVTYYLGVDAGATRLRAAVATAPDEVVGRGEQPTPQGSDEGGEAVTGALLAAVRAACGDASVEPGELSAAGIGTFGPVDRAAGAVLRPANVDGAERIRMVGPLAELLGIDREAVDFRNDTAAGAVGERSVADDPPANSVYLTISTGIGAGVVLDDRVVSGHRGNAGEVGHATVDPAGRMDCLCGGAGHWEAYCCGNSIPRYTAHLHRTEDVGTELPLGEPEFGAADVFEAAGEDDLATLAVERIAEWNTVGVANLVQSFAPEHVAVGGAVALRNRSLVLKPVRERLPGRLTVDPPSVAPAALGEEAVLRGALVGACRVATAENDRPG